MTTSARRRLIPLLAVLLGAAVPACGADPLVIPQPPQDLTATAQAYETPTGTIDPSQLQQIVANARTQLVSMNLDWLPTLILDTLTRVRARLAIAGLPVDPSVARRNNRPKFDAVLVVQHSCGGWTDTPTAADAGSSDVALTAVVQDTQLQRAIWGTAASCRARVQPISGLAVNAFLDGTVSMFAQGPLPENNESAEVLVAVSGQVGTENHIATTSVDFRIVGTQVEFRHAVADGDVIVSVGPQAIDVRGSNASYTCDVSTLACALAP